MAGRRQHLLQDDKALLGECEEDRFRASGPGGQKRNKTESAIRLRHRPTGISAQASDSRSQAENRTRALRRLRLAIATGFRVPLELAQFSPSPALAQWITTRGAQPGRKDPKRALAIAELLDLLALQRGVLADTAALLGASTAALSKVITKEPALLEAANQLRAQHDLRPLRP